jgi:DNA-binding NarL/FixJ family response regulator
MPVQIAISDPLPIFRQGLKAALGSAVFDPAVPSDLLAWSRDEQARLVFLTLQSAQDWSLLLELQNTATTVTVVAVLTDISTTTWVRAILSGAAAAVPRDAPPETMRRVFEAALEGESLLPFDVVRALASVREPVAGDQERLAPREIEWLRALAEGATVAQLAEQAGYSERAMFRLLRDLYARMRVKTRTEALMRANERGWL